VGGRASDVRRWFLMELVAWNSPTLIKIIEQKYEPIVNIIIIIKF
jgi:hypothetical protein